MTDQNRTIDLTEDRRRAIFLSLVNAQDSGIRVRLSRDRIAKEFKVTIRQIQAVELEGIEHLWPPLAL